MIFNMLKKEKKFQVEVVVGFTKSDTSYSEKRQINKLVKKYDFQGIYLTTDLGFILKKIPSVFITHQLNVLSGGTTWFSSKAHQRIIKFAACWVPDVQGKPNLTGKLGHLKNTELEIE